MTRVDLLEKIQLVGVGFQSLTEAIDTTTPVGRMMMQIVGSFAESERVLRERTRNGLLAARKEGRVGGRRPKLSPLQQRQIVFLVETDQKTAADAACLFNVHPEWPGSLPRARRRPQISLRVLYFPFSEATPELVAGVGRLPDESPILGFCHLPEKHALSAQLPATIHATLAKRGLLLKTGTVVDATLIAPPSSTKNTKGERDPVTPRCIRPRRETSGTSA